jgi:hypothetical protein
MTDSADAPLAFKVLSARVGSSVETMVSGPTSSRRVSGARLHMHGGRNRGPRLRKRTKRGPGGTLWQE